MAIDLTLKSTYITDREAIPKVVHNPGQGGIGTIQSAYGYILSVTAALSITSVIRMVDVPSNAMVHSIKLSSGAQTAGKFSVGVYRTNADGGLVAAASADQFYTAALDCAAAVVETECILLATTLNTIAKRNQPIWQAIGMTVDPVSRLDICCTVTTTAVTTGTGALSLLVLYTV